MVGGYPLQPAVQRSAPTAAEAQTAVDPSVRRGKTGDFQLQQLCVLGEVHTYGKCFLETGHICQLHKFDALAKVIGEGKLPLLMAIILAPAPARLPAAVILPDNSVGSNSMAQALSGFR